MNIIDAAYHTVHDYPGGSVALGPRMGVSAAVLRNKVNPNCDTHRLTLAEADRMIGLTGDMRLLQALAATHGYVLTRAEADNSGGGASTLGAVLAEHVADGKLASGIAAALADGVITPREADAITQLGMGVQSALIALLAHIARQVPPPPADIAHA